MSLLVTKHVWLKHPRLLTCHFDSFFSLPETSKTQRHRDGPTHNNHRWSTHSHVGSWKLPRLDPFKVKAKSSSLPGRMHWWFDSTKTSSFSSKFPSNFGPFLLLQLTDLLSSPNRSKFQERLQTGSHFFALFLSYLFSHSVVNIYYFLIFVNTLIRK